MDAQQKAPTFPDSVLRVGEGRGFMLGDDDSGDRFIITACHCLPHLPPAGPTYIEERIYQSFVSRLGEDRRVSVECLFADPVSDIAVLGQADPQSCAEEAIEYSRFDEGIQQPFRIGDASDEITHDIDAWLVSLDGHLFRCKMRGACIHQAAEDIAGGMSGSPILGNDGRAIAVLTNGRGIVEERCRESDRSPFLTKQLPGWILERLPR